MPTIGWHWWCFRFKIQQVLRVIDLTVNNSLENHYRKQNIHTITFSNFCVAYHKAIISCEIRVQEKVVARFAMNFQYLFFISFSLFLKYLTLSPHFFSDLHSDDCIKQIKLSNIHGFTWILLIDLIVFIVLDLK